MEWRTGAAGAACLLVLMPSCGIATTNSDYDELNDAHFWCDEPDVGEVARVIVSRSYVDQVSTGIELVDSEGRRLASMTDLGSDGIFDRKRLTQRDSLGNVLLEEDDSDGDGVFDAVAISDYDDQGRRVSRQVDQGPDGIADTLISWDYSVPDRVVERVDRSADGSVDGIETTFLENGRVVRVETDADASGSVDKIDTYRYAEDGGVLEETSDTDADGFPERVVTREFNENGQPILIRARLSADGLESTTSVEYDADGFPFASRTEYDGDLRDTRKFTVDIQGRIIRSVETGSQGQLTIVEFEYRGAEEDPTNIRRDFRGDGSWEFAQTTIFCSDVDS